MIRTKIEVSDVQIKVIEAGVFTAGMMGAKVEMEFTDPLWNDLEKVVTFLCGHEKKVATVSGNTVEIPHEVLRRGRRELYIGLCGYDAKRELCLPTLWARLGEVLTGADPSGDPGLDPSLPVWAEILDKIGDLGQLLQEGYQPKGDYLTQQDISGKLDAAKLPEAVNAALAQAEASGSFKGDPGYTPRKGVDYFDGIYTLGAGETLADVPYWAQVVLDPDKESPELNMVVTFEDGTTGTYTIFGEVVK